MPRSAGTGHGFENTIDREQSVGGLVRSLIKSIDAVREGRAMDPLNATMEEFAADGSTLTSNAIARDAA